MGMIQAGAGNEAEAKRLLGEIEEAAKHQYVCNYEIAQVYTSLGDHQERV